MNRREFIMWAFNEWWPALWLAGVGLVTWFVIWLEPWHNDDDESRDLIGD